MKKKAIEKIPYFGLKKTSRKKDVKYIGVTAVKIVGHEKHLFLEVYRNKKESKEIPVVRIVLTKKDFGTYWPEKEEWTRQTSHRDRGAAGGSGQNTVRKEKEVQEKRVESIREVDFSGLKVPFVAVYGHPDDFPDKYVARIYELDRATDTIMVKETLEEIEMDIKEHTAMTFIPRGTADVPSLVGVWM